jgi:hypothetical protein
MIAANEADFIGGTSVTGPELDALIATAPMADFSRMGRKKVRRKMFQMLRFHLARADFGCAMFELYVGRSLGGIGYAWYGRIAEWIWRMEIGELNLPAHRDSRHEPKR